MPTKSQDISFAECMQEHVEVRLLALDVAIEWIQKELSPDNVFTDKQLQEWAENNGYIKE